MLPHRRTTIRKLSKTCYRPSWQVGLVLACVLFAIIHWSAPFAYGTLFTSRRHVRETLPQRPPVTSITPSQAGHQRVVKPWLNPDEEEEASADDLDEKTDEEIAADVLEMDEYYAKHDGHPFDDFGDQRDVYHELYSISKLDRKYYAIHMDGIPTFNANLLPHPTRVDMWIAVASRITSTYVESLSCNVGMLNDVLVCAETPAPLAIEQAVEGSCNPETLAIFNMYRGPRDIRVFWGPDTPYVTFGSPSRFGCLGQWIQDARELLKPYSIEAPTGSKLFHGPTELQRPKDYLLTRETIDKNFFIFWDFKGAAYVHYSVWPSRSFAKLDFDGSVGEDLAPLTKGDRLCLLENMPVFNIKEWFEEKLHQATNSLSITLCKRAEPGCKQGPENTFIMHIFHRRRYHRHHATYQPYVILFEQESPFKLHSVSPKALWVHGRTLVSETTGVSEWAEHPDRIPGNHSEMFFITSISWKNHGQKYHGYLDDPLWLNFGREDVQAGSIDVIGENLVQDMSLCYDPDKAIM